MSDLDAVLRGIHSCPGGLTCQPGRGVCYPAAPMGRASEGVDVLLVGWNPRVAWYANAVMPGYASRREEWAGALAAPDARRDEWARRVAALLPKGRRLDDGRTVATFVWKWPTRVKTGGEGERFYAGRCVEKHFRDELAALRPRLVVAYEKEASEFFAAEAEARGVRLRDAPPAVRSGETRGWAAPSDEWGWPMGLLLLRDAHGRYHPDTARFAHAVADRVLGPPPERPEEH